MCGKEGFLNSKYIPSEWNGVDDARELEGF